MATDMTNEHPLDQFVDRPARTPRAVPAFSGELLVSERPDLISHSLGTAQFRQNVVFGDRTPLLSVFGVD
jgi:hypothetical protein